MRTMRLALAQINPTVGDLAGNCNKIIDYTRKAIDQKVDIIAFPELALTGYPPEDLLLRPEFIDENLYYLEKLFPLSKKITILTGFVDRRDDIFNAAAVLHRGAIAGVYHKRFLPNYSVFDENRYFQEGKTIPVFNYQDINIGVNVCEDIWYPGGPTHYQALYGNAEVIINLSASPYAMGKIQDRNKMLSVRAADNGVILAYVNLVGGQDELIFDGHSLILSEDGYSIARAPGFEEALLIADLHPDNVFGERLHDPRRRKQKLFIPPDKEIRNIPLPVEKPHPVPEPLEPQIVTPLDIDSEAYAALKLGVHDYITKNGFSKVVIGLSGGIDSALVCVIAADALGSENVTAISMPSRYTSEHSKDDARKLAENLGVTFHEVAIEQTFNSFMDTLEALFEGAEPDITEENLQARIRGTILMAFSNKFGAIVLTTGNKSEMGTGYCTLYGDMVGGLAVIKDVPKLLVYQLCRYRNQLAGHDLIPESILTKAPSAELRHDQKDTDSLPPYEILDPIIKAYVEDDLSVEEIISQGFEKEVVTRIIGLVDRSEYKRRQGAPGIKITGRAFGKDRRFPITNRFKNGGKRD